MDRKARVYEYARRRDENGGSRVDFRTHSRQQLEATQREVQNVLNDPYRSINPQEQHNEAMRIAREGQQRHIAAVQEAEQAYEAEVERLERMANPAPKRGQRSTAELLERRELLDMNRPRWSRGGGDAVLEDYRKALRDGDEMMAELVENYGREFIEDHAKAQEFGDLVYEQQRSRLPASAQNALEQLEQLVADEYQIKAGMAHQKSTLAGFVDNVRKGQPIVTRDDIEGMRSQGKLAQVGGR